LLSASVAAAAGGSSAASMIAERTVVIQARPEPLKMDLRRTALIVVDMQNAFGAPGGMFDRAGIDISGIRAVVPAVLSAVASARAAGLPVVFLKMGFRPDLSDAGPSDGPNLLKHAPFHVGQDAPAPGGRPNRILIRDTWDTEIIPELQPQLIDLVLYKRSSPNFNRSSSTSCSTRPATAASSARPSTMSLGAAASPP
jgi:ureidoacrylate peracid hydrolase